MLYIAVCIQSYIGLYTLLQTRTFIKILKQESILLKYLLTNFVLK